uniref:Oxidoreductase FAD/NAD(P)-binding domain-containing protein n=2 Tax=Odontella aurita TaxID=265563 RepID=A0A7S4JLA3_9STRA|mmetsp:Transcript_48594/g.146556  ORF Transcript_48594/g.146556 Transcript_48594/m.146556 type:complete len:290 (+) Transcript_48594:96-965(+)
MKTFVAYSRVMDNKMYVQDLIKKESDIILMLLHNPKTHIYICGAPAMEYAVRNELLMALCVGNETYPRINIGRAVEKIVLMQQQNRFVTEVYGTLTSSARDATETLWREATTKVAKTLSSLEKVTLPRARSQIEFKPVATMKGASWSSHVRPEHACEMPKTKSLDRLKARKQKADTTANYDHTLDSSRCPIESSNSSSADSCDVGSSVGFESMHEQENQLDSPEPDNANDGKTGSDDEADKFEASIRHTTTTSWRQRFVPQLSQSMISTTGLDTTDFHTTAFDDCTGED